MSSFLESLFQYKEIILISLSIILFIIGIFIKRRPKTLDDFKLVVSDVLSLIPDFINQVERPSCGSEKRSEVLSACFVVAQKKLGRSLSSSESSILSSACSKQIEEILSTPQKKRC